LFAVAVTTLLPLNFRMVAVFIPAPPAFGTSAGEQQLRA
jgi:hypothetical protein